MKLQQKNYWQRVALYLFVFVVSIVILYPYFVMFTTAAKTNAEMVQHILDFDDAEYQKDWDAFYEKMGFCEDGQATQRCSMPTARCRRTVP